MAPHRIDIRVGLCQDGLVFLAAQTGATLAELMARLGHSTPGAAADERAFRSINCKDAQNYPSRTVVHWKNPIHVSFG